MSLTFHAWRWWTENGDGEEIVSWERWTRGQQRDVGHCFSGYFNKMQGEKKKKKPDSFAECSFFLKVQRLFSGAAVL